MLKKTLRRYKGPVAAACALLLTLTGGLVVSWTLYARAVAAEALANRRFDDVRALANTFLFDFHDRIKDLAGSTPAREFVVETALEYLDKLASEAGDDLSLQRELAAAYQKVGDVQGSSVSAGDLGDTQGALASYRNALEINEALLTADPANANARRDLGVSYYHLGSASASLGSELPVPVSQRLGRWREARGWHQRSLRLFEDMRERGVLSGADSGVPDELNAEIARCDQAIAELEQVVEPASDHASQPAPSQP